MICEHNYVLTSGPEDNAHANGGVRYRAQCSYCHHCVFAFQTFAAVALGVAFMPERASWQSVRFCPCTPCVTERLLCQHDFKTPSLVCLSTFRLVCRLCGTLGERAGSVTLEPLSNMAGVLNGGLRAQKDGSFKQLN